ncbi:hypothetical protein E4U53_008079 [Claviceps sorghi]|nr:hypothetical protein E4U53_008079 [Claviceps sorghi]
MSTRNGPGRDSVCESRVAALGVDELCERCRSLEASAVHVVSALDVSALDVTEPERLEGPKRPERPPRRIWRDQTWHAFSSGLSSGSSSSFPLQRENPTASLKLFLDSLTTRHSPKPVCSKSPLHTGLEPTLKRILALARPSRYAAMNTQYGSERRVLGSLPVPSQQDYPQCMARSTSNHSGSGIDPSYDTVDLLAYLDQNGNAPEVGIHPGTYLSANDWCDEQSLLDFAATCSLPDEACSNYILHSTPPSMVSGPSAFEPAQPVTRQNSAWNGSNGVDMARRPSSQSYETRNSSVQEPVLPAQQDDRYAMNSTSHPDLAAIGARFAPPHAYLASPFNNAGFLAPPTSESMQRSVSNLSCSSTRSSASSAGRRLRKTLTKQLENGKVNRIRPKLPAASPAASTSPSTHHTGGKEKLPKSPYQRPRGPKVFCTKCNEQPEGFRGEHELRRHRKAKHSVVVKKYICRDPALVGLGTTVSVVHPLSECKACTGGKEYGIDYNAAAHLRRAHFKPKPPRGRKKKPDDEKRGGKGGGNWPSMPELKPWIMEVLVARVDNEVAPATRSPLIRDDANTDDEEEDEDDDGDPIGLLGEAADTVPSEYIVDNNYDALLQDTQTQNAMALVAGDAHLKGFYDIMSHVDDTAYDADTVAENRLNLDQAFASAHLFDQDQVFTWAIDNE